MISQTNIFQKTSVRIKSAFILFCIKWFQNDQFALQFSQTHLALQLLCPPKNAASSCHDKKAIVYNPQSKKSQERFNWGKLSYLARQMIETLCLYMGYLLIPTVSFL
jgi:hypothetical protein